MMKRHIHLIFLSLFFTCSFLYAQQTVTGVVRDSETNEALFGVNIYLPQYKAGTTTDQTGYFRLKVPKVGTMIQFSFVGYRTREISYDGSATLEIALKPETNLEEIVIKAIRAENEAPVAQTTIDRKKIQEEYVGQDATFVLANTIPSVVAYSESGTNFSNYSQFRLRGIDQSRVNITLNGVPLNDMIDQGVFFSNFTDFSNNVQSVQVQRGVGTSTNGTASYAGSISFESIELKDDKPSADIQLTGGSFDTYRASIGVKTGILKNRTAFYSRFTTFTSDGYKYHSGTKSYSFYASGGYFGENDLIKFTTFIGRSQNGLAYAPVAISDIKQDPKTNYINENDRDNFGQQFFQMQHTHLFDDQLSLVSSLYYGGAGGDYPAGYYETDSIYTAGQNPPYYTVDRLVQINYPLTNRHFGVMSNVNFTSDNQKLSIHGGLHAYTFHRNDQQAIIPDYKHPYYDEHSRKDEVSLFGKANYRLGDWNIYGDLQFRTLKLTINPDDGYLPGESDVVKKWTFINPRVGLTYNLDNTKNLYVSFGRSGREPTKVDILGGFELNASNLSSVLSDAVKPEFVNDLEGGLTFNYPNLTGQLNLFYMKFTDEIAPIGKYVPEGFIQLRKNVPSSYRRGIELDFNWLINRQLTFGGNTTFMQSQIKTYAPSDDPNVYHDVQPALSPQWMANGTINYHFLHRFDIGLTGKYLGESYQEPTNNEAFKMPAFFVMDAKISVAFGKGHSFDFYLNNIFDKLYFTNGAPVDIDYDGTFDEPGYFVQPPRNFYAKLNLRF